MPNSCGVIGADRPVGVHLTTTALIIALITGAGPAVARPSPARPLTLHVGGAGGGGRAVVHARARRALELARRAYAASKFRRCADLLATSGAQLQHHLRDAADLRLVKRLELWLGLCQQLAGAEEAASAAWVRAARLPGPGPDPDLFPPQVMQRYRALTRGGQIETCTLGPAARGVQIDGKPAAPGETRVQGEHYVIWTSRAGARSARRTLGAACKLRPLASPPMDADRISAEESADVAFLGEVGRAAGADKLWIFDARGAALKVSVFDVAGKTFTRSRPLLSSTGGSPSSAPVAAPPTPTPWYGRWWVWTLIGAGVAAAVVIPVVATQEERYDLVF